MESSRTPRNADEAHSPVTSDAGDALHQKEAVCLFAYARAKRLTGSFELGRPGEEIAATVVVERGSVSKIKTIAPVAFLSTVLLEMGFLEADALMTSLVELGKRERLHGEILIADGRITPVQLQKGLHEQTTRKLDYVLSLGTLAFRFHEERNLLASYGGTELVRIDPLASIWKSVRVAPPEAHLRTSLARVADVRVKLASTEQTSRFRFSSEELELVEYVRTRDVTLPELKEQHILSPRETELLFYTLLITKQLEAGAHPAAAAAKAAASPPSSRQERRSWTLTGVSLAMFQEQAQSSPPPPPSSRPSTPSMQAPGSSRPGAPSSRPSSGSMPAVRPPPPRQASGSLAPVRPPPPRRQSAGSMVAVEAPPSSRPSSPAAPAPPSSPPPSHTYAIAGSRPAPPIVDEDPPTRPKGPPLPHVRAHDMFERAKAILREDYFERLSVSPEATEEAVEAAFQEQASVWSGLVPPEIEGAQEAQDTVLTALLEAHDTLGDRALREAYTKGLLHGRR